MTNFHDLNDTSGSNTQNQRLVPRVALAHEQFRLKDNAKIFSVMDLSPMGFSVRLLDPEDLALFPVGRSIEGNLKFQEKIVNIQCKVVHISSTRVGFQFSDEGGALKTFFTEMMTPDFLASELKLLPSNGKLLRWYHGPCGTELLFFSEKETAEIDRFLCIFLGNFLQWENGILSTGRARVAKHIEQTQGVVHWDWFELQPEPEAVTGTQVPDISKVAFLEKLVQKARIIEDPYKSWIERVFNVNSKL